MFFNWRWISADMNHGERGAAYSRTQAVYLQAAICSEVSSPYEILTRDFSKRRSSELEHRSRLTSFISRILCPTKYLLRSVNFNLKFYFILLEFHIF